MADEREVLVEVKNLEVTYGSGRKAYKAVKNANFTIYKGETFGLCLLYTSDAADD